LHGTTSFQVLGKSDWVLHLVV